MGNLPKKITFQIFNDGYGSVRIDKVSKTADFNIIAQFCDRGESKDRDLLFRSLPHQIPLVVECKAVKKKRGGYLEVIRFRPVGDDHLNDDDFYHYLPQTEIE